MRNVHIHHQPLATITLTADDWALYGNEGRDNAAKELSRLAEQAINTSANRSEVETKLSRALELYSEFGANDTEGRGVMYELFDAAFPYRR